MGQQGLQRGGKRLGVKFSGLSQEAPDFLFSRSGKCQVGQKPLRHMEGNEQIEGHCLGGARSRPPPLGFGSRLPSARGSSARH